MIRTAGSPDLVSKATSARSFVLEMSNYIQLVASGGKKESKKGPLFWIDCVNINSGQVRDTVMWSVILMQLWALSA